ncbi:hypothetical protein BD309DRAFT_657196 [Dichomitus squalens]|uniref:Uncharacterized protein n=1 Tax=Dichomitus squalens TaxID=114155 RepID=A0A4Q9NA80_9APHY|nr:hypothetical protein BD309DRAFT_657196 [Dichomitus squalens]TBU58243.1 hypothetical protein BD310DRAFT_495596 [Dichomitus squalens]
MWVLSTERAELTFFATPESVPGGYAILSHVWDETEQTFQDIKLLHSCNVPADCNPRDFASSKVRNFCVLAESHGYQWAWIDTCCIDKASSAELSEAINSMFQYYALADVCYAYLRDVPSQDYVEGESSDFRSSLWHKRGWTLQELVAPETVVFLSSEWKALGTKCDLAFLLEGITSVPAGILRMEAELTSVSIAARMSWAADRNTTRPEDQAYCLMGIFKIHMPLLYGEGPQAFRRLQDEIMKQHIDTSILAWGPIYQPRPHRDNPKKPIHDHSEETYLFASSPSAFRGCTGRRAIIPNRSSGDASRQVSEADTIGIPVPSMTDLATIPTFTNTPYGVLAHIPIIEAHDLIIAPLFCCNYGRQLGLLLSRCPNAIDPARPLYHICFRFRDSRFDSRLIDLGSSFATFQLNGKRVTAQWKTVYLADRPPSTPPPTRVPMNRSMFTPFRLPRAHLRDLERHWDVQPLCRGGIPGRLWNGLISFSFSPRQPVGGGLPSQTFTIYLGRCAEGVTLGAHWVRVTFKAPPDQHSRDASNGAHDCSLAHVRDWPALTKTFSTPGRTLNVQLTFVPCHLNPDATLVLSMNAGGSIRSPT